MNLRLSPAAWRPSRSLLQGFLLEGEGRKYRLLELRIARSVAVMMSLGFATAACSDDDGSNILPNSMLPMGGSGGAGMAGSAGAAGSSGSAGSAGLGGTAGAGAGGAAGMAGSAGMGGDGGSAGCIPVAPDAGALDAGDPDAATDGGALGVVSFAADIHPIFVQSCGPCHVTDGSAGHNVGGPDVAAAYAEAVNIGERLIERVDEGGGMPPSYADPPNNCVGGPGDPGCLTLEEFALLQTWFAQCSPP